MNNAESASCSYVLRPASRISESYEKKNSRQEKNEKEEKEGNRSRDQQKKTKPGISGIISRKKKLHKNRSRKNQFSTSGRRGGEGHKCRKKVEKGACRNTIVDSAKKKVRVHAQYICVCRVYAKRKSPGRSDQDDRSRRKIEYSNVGAAQTAQRGCAMT